MNDFIEVWRPKIIVPKFLKEEIAKVTAPSRNPAWGDLRDDYGVEPLKIGGIGTLFCDGVCGWHHDKHNPDQYSLLFVVKNETGSYVESKMAPPVLEQPAGTMIFLNIWKTHRLWHPKGTRSPLGIYLAFCIDLKVKPGSKQECTKMMKNYINEGIAQAA